MRPNELSVPFSTSELSSENDFLFSRLGVASIESIARLLEVRGVEEGWSWESTDGREQRTRPSSNEELECQILLAKTK